MFCRFPLEEPLRDVCRSMSLEYFNALANHESVRPYIGGDGTLDLAPIVDGLEHFCFATAHGGFVLVKIGSGRYDVHSFFRPEGRGEEARRGMEQVAAYMFTRTDCTEGRTTVPTGNPGAHVLAKRAGFELRFEMAHFPWQTGVTTSAAFLALTIEKWALTSSDALAAGRWFHDALETAKVAAGSERETHPDDAVHDRMAGAAVLMIMGGQARKAVAFYNAWAHVARYAQITLVSEHPCVLDIGDAIIEARADGMEVLRCR